MINAVGDVVEEAKELMFRRAQKIHDVLNDLCIVGWSRWKYWPWYMLHATHGSVPAMDIIICIHGDGCILMVALHPSHGRLEISYFLFH